MPTVGKAPSSGILSTGREPHAIPGVTLPLTVILTAHRLRSPLHPARQTALIIGVIETSKSDADAEFRSTDALKKLDAGDPDMHRLRQPYPRIHGWARTGGNRQISPRISRGNDSHLGNELPDRCRHSCWVLPCHRVARICDYRHLHTVLRQLAGIGIWQ